MRRLVVVALLTVFASGCSILPDARSIDSLPRSSAKPHKLNACLAPVRLDVIPLERNKDYDCLTVVDPEAMQRDVSRWLQHHNVFLSVRESEAETAEEVFDEAWEAQDDVVVQINLVRYRTDFDGHNALWVPNMVLWWLIMAPAWFVPTEEYSLSLRVEVEVFSAHSGKRIHFKRLPVRVESVLNEFGRGFWTIFGVFGPRNDAADWRRIAETMVDAARAEVAALATRELRDGFDGGMDRTRKTMALAIGVSRYPEETLLPPLPYAAHDAETVAMSLIAGAGLRDRHVTLLQDDVATRKGVLDGLKRLRDRARKGDRVVIYFAGYGTRGESGEPVLLLNQGRMSLSDLAKELKTIEGDVLLMIDAGFDGQGRSVAGGKAPEDRDDLAVMTAAGAATLLASTPGDQLVTPEQAGASLFAFHLARGLRGAADQEPNGKLTPAELFTLVSEHVVADAAYFGASQQPVAAGLRTSSFVLDLGGTR